ncbi:MAG: DUF4339 domain-containing protein [Simkaniaceae bacterium]|nr:DUF4339 domain-containing protein [Simkaniaceae bacterium]
MNQETLMFVLFLSWIILGVLCLRIARKKNRHPVGWFFIGFSLGIFGVILLLILPRKKKKVLSPNIAGIPTQTANKSMEEVTHSSYSLNPPINDPEMSKYWYYLDKDSTEQGPISFDALNRQYQTQDLPATTYVWSEDMDNWKKINELPEKFKQLPNN